MDVCFNVPDIVSPGVSIKNDTTVVIKFYIAENAKLGSRILKLKYSGPDIPEYIITDSSFTVFKPNKQIESDK